MQIIKINPKDPIFVGELVACTGYFDGIHLGHQTLLEKAKEVSKHSNLKKALVTFVKSPKDLIKGNCNPNNFTTLKERASKIEKYDFDYLIALDFDKDTLTSMSAKQFINMLEKIGVKHIVCGDDYFFGKGKEGSAFDIEKISNGNILASIMPIVSIDGVKIGSTQIKEMLQHNDVKGAAKMLGEDFSIEGVVENGKKLGREIGFPTANIYADNEMAIYLHGVFAVLVKYNGNTHKGVANIGFNPSVEQDKKAKVLEVHIFEFCEDIYGKTIKVIFKDFIRGEKKFNSIDELVAQIQKDKIAALNILG